MAKTSKDKEQFDRNGIKVRGFGRFKKSFGYSLDGLKYAYKYEQSMFIHFLFTIFVIVMGIVFRISAFEWLVTFLCIGMVLAAELVNTAIEAVVDLVTTDIHPLAKIAKDCGSAATFILACMAAVVGCIVYIPHILALFGI